jgi:integrase
MVIARFEYLRDGHGPAWANLCMRLLRSLFNLAIAKYADEEGRSPFVNPVRVLSETRSWARIDRRRTLIAPHDLRAWHDAVANLTPTAHAYLVTVLLTGLRRREAGSLRWEDIDFDRGTLTVRQTKNGKPHVLPIPNYLRGLLSGLKTPGAFADSYVFPGAASNTGRLQAAVFRVSGVRFTIHDLRRTFITVAESLDIPAFALKRLLNHSDGQDVTAGYIVIGTERLRAPIEKIAGYFESAMGIEEKQVAPFSKIA